jgi:hypothetical protein
MKTVLSIVTETEDKIDLLIRVAEEMGLKVERKNTKDISFLVSEASLAEAWNSPEDTRWDEAFAHLKK